MKKTKAVFLDRDGVINRARVVDGKSYPPQELEDFELLPGVGEALESFRRAGYLNIVVTNQPDVRTGVQELSVVEAMHEKLRSQAPVDAIYVCYHTDQDNCDCRKPSPGMLMSAQKEHGIDFSKSILVGDRWKDIEAGQAVGCRCFFIDYEYKERKPTGSYNTVKDLVSVVDLI